MSSRSSFSECPSETLEDLPYPLATMRLLQVHWTNRGDRCGRGSIEPPREWADLCSAIAHERCRGEGDFEGERVVDAEVGAGVVYTTTYPVYEEVDISETAELDSASQHPNEAETSLSPASMPESAPTSSTPLKRKRSTSTDEDARSGADHNSASQHPHEAESSLRSPPMPDSASVPSTSPKRKRSSTNEAARSGVENDQPEAPRTEDEDDWWTVFYQDIMALHLRLQTLLSRTPPHLLSKEMAQDDLLRVFDVATDVLEDTREIGEELVETLEEGTASEVEGDSDGKEGGERVVDVSSWDYESDDGERAGETEDVGVKVHLDEFEEEVVRDLMEKVERVEGFCEGLLREAGKRLGRL